MIGIQKTAKANIKIKFLKIIIATIWWGMIIFIILELLATSKSLSYIFKNYFLAYIFLVICFGCISSILEIFYKNISFVFFIYITFITSVFAFIVINLKFIGVLPSPLKGFDFDIWGLVRIYIINSIFFLLSIKGLKKYYKKEKFIIYFLISCLYNALFFLFFNNICWSL